jgi:hypothetical protein
MSRERAALTFDIEDESFAPKQKPKDTTPPKAKQKLVKAAASKEGFTSRTTIEKIDGRTLRRTGRGVQFNISVSQEAKDQFWELAQHEGCTSGGEFLQILIDKFKTTRG